MVSGPRCLLANNAEISETGLRDVTSWLLRQSRKQLGHNYTIISTAAVEIQNKRNCRHVILKTAIKRKAFYEQQRTTQYRRLKTF